MTDTQAPGLLPCPFCGGEAEKDYMQSYAPLAGGPLGHACAIYCLGCGANMTECHVDHPGLTPEDIMVDLVDRWNTRTDLAHVITGTIKEIKG